MSFDVSFLCVFTVSVPPPPFLLGGQLLLPKFEKGGDYQRKKMSAWVDLKSSCHGYLPRGGEGLTMFLVKNDF